MRTFPTCLLSWSSLTNKFCSSCTCYLQKCLHSAVETYWRTFLPAREILCPNYRHRHGIQWIQGSGADYLGRNQETRVLWCPTHSSLRMLRESKRKSDREQKFLQLVCKAYVTRMPHPWQHVWGFDGREPFCPILGALTFLSENGISFRLERLTCCWPISDTLLYVAFLSFGCFFWIRYPVAFWLSSVIQRLYSPPEEARQEESCSAVSSSRGNQALYS